MALTELDISDSLGTSYAESGLTATPVKAIGGGAIDVGGVRLDNGALSAAYLRAFDSANPTLTGSNDKLRIKVPASANLVLTVRGTDGAGVPFNTALTLALTDTANGNSLTGAGRPVRLHNIRQGA